MLRFSLFLASILCLQAANWPSWRGVDFNGISVETGIPTKWSKTENVKWHVDLPEPGNSTPIVWGDSIFVTQPKKATGQRVLLCFDRKTGKLRWEGVVPFTEQEPTHPTNPYASASAAADGERVIAWFGSAGLVSWDRNGKQLWKTDLGRQRHTWGYASSPVIHGDRVFLNFGPGDRAFLAALDKRTGKTLWQVDIPAGKGAKFGNWTPEDMYGSWSTPLVVKAGGREELVVTHPKVVTAYDPATGKVLWTCDGMGDLVYPSPLLGTTSSGDSVIFAPSGFGGPVLAVKPGGSGDVTATHRLWHQPKSKNTIGTGIVKDGYLYVIDNSGIANCLNLATGETTWTQRLPTKSEDNGVWSSPVLNQGRIFVMNKSGHTVVFQASPKQFELLGVNALDEPTNSSVVISDGDVILRTHQALWCIRAR